MKFCCIVDYGIRHDSIRFGINTALPQYAATTMLLWGFTYRLYDTGAISLPAAAKTTTESDTENARGSK